MKINFQIKTMKLFRVECQSRNDWKSDRDRSDMNEIDGIIRFDSFALN